MYCIKLLFWTAFSCGNSIGHITGTLLSTTSIWRYTSFSSWEFSLEIREKMGPGLNESPAGAIISLALFSTSSMSVLRRQNGAGGKDMVSAF